MAIQRRKKTNCINCNCLFDAADTEKNRMAEDGLCWRCGDVVERAMERASVKPLVFKCYRCKKRYQMRMREDFPEKGLARCPACDRGIEKFNGKGKAKEYPLVVIEEEIIFTEGDFYQKQRCIVCEKLMEESDISWCLDCRRPICRTCGRPDIVGRCPWCSSNYPV